MPDMKMEDENEIDEKEEEKMDEEESKARNLRMFPFGKHYALSPFGVIRILTIIFCLGAFIAIEMAPCQVGKSCYPSTHRYFSAISFLIFSSSLILYILYVTGVVQRLPFHPRVKTIVEGSYFGACIFFYLFACVFVIPRNPGTTEFQVASVFGVFGLVLLAVHFALLLYNVNKQSAITFESRENSSCDEETAQSWVATAASEDNQDNVPTLQTIRYRASTIEPTDNPPEMVEVTLTDSPTPPNKASSRSSSSLSSSSSDATVEGSWKVVET